MDSWKPSASLQLLQSRAQLYRQIRAFFESQGVLEVETPIISCAANTDPHIQSLSVSNQKQYLQTSPEFAMKRLLASGCGPIFQICKAFRSGESGTRHNSEFSLLEWYRPGFDHFRLMDEVAFLMHRVWAERPVERLSYRQVFMEKLEIDPHAIGASELMVMAKELTGFSNKSHAPEDKDTLLNLLMSHLIEPQLGKGKLTFIYHYPASQCALAKVSNDEQGVEIAQRFELYVEGLELANGYNELTDAREQQRRMSQDLNARRRSGMEQLPADSRLIQALEYGLPDCAGVALGIDRLLMLKSGIEDISQVLSFPDAIA